jgi:pimeloyl-ACP methyl ester carboxylesterase
VTVVLVHGAGAGAWMWRLVARELDARGVAHAEVDLPTCGTSVDPNLDFHTDAAHVRDTIDGIDGPVVLVANSYGGVVITEAGWAHPGVSHLVYVAAFMPDRDENVWDLMGRNATPEFVPAVRVGEDGLFTYDPAVVQALAMQQAPPEVGAWAAGAVGPIAMGMRGSPFVAGAAWREVPSTYVVCADDRSLQPASQRRWASERATDRVEVPYDHCPQLSHPAEIAAVLASVAPCRTT